MIRMHGEYRRHLRSGIRVPVILKYANHTIEANTLDVSASGLRLKRPEGVYIRPGEVTDVDFRDNADMNVAATVAYTGKSHIGLEFCGRRFSEYELRELYEIAPSWQRLKARSKRALWTNSRRFAVLLANTYLRRLIHALARPHFVFAVYGNRPGPISRPVWRSVCRPIWYWVSFAIRTCEACWWRRNLWSTS